MEASFFEKSASVYLPYSHLPVKYFLMSDIPLCALKQIHFTLLASPDFLKLTGKAISNTALYRGLLLS